MFGKPVSLFSVFGFEIKVDMSWLILAALITWSLASGLFPEYYKDLPKSAYWWMGIAGAIGLFLSIIVHELTHSIVARHYGVSMKEITLFIFGGVAHMEEDPSSPKAEFMIAVVGPVSSFLLAASAFLLYKVGVYSGWPVTLTGVLNYLSWLNMILAVFNLIPAFPLDGGRILRSALWKWKKDIRWSTNIAAQIGSGFGLMLIIMGIFYIVKGNFVGGLWWFLIGLFVRAAAQSSYRQILARNLFHAKKVRDLMVTNPVTVPRAISLEDFIRDYVYKYHFQAYPVVSFGRLTGCIFLKQVASIPREQWAQHTVGSVAVPCSKEITIGPDEDANKALDLMNRTGNSRLLVVQGDELEGILSLKDMLALLSLKMELNDMEKKT
ncbi:MAG TPA: site-2 protease family protein [Smithella sp.]|jgi:Zn-dependent protease|nr:site-2 protease family protein [Smithella sp.]NMC96904.1 CBS domain-containing protein [Deltaproteobacteria bacterium]HNQ66521.1 site-2 protease family protein [Smithella sp.]HOE33342.1 site-2 protease family protein [Smithella sp.]HOO36422.1 site-2 protease family protein [Smithella sp.]